MAHFYQVYGLRIRATHPLPGLMPADGADAVDLCIDLNGSDSDRFQSMPKQLWYASRKDRYGNFAHVWKLAGNAYYRFDYNDGARFVIDRRASRIWAMWPSDLTLADILTYLTGHILGFALGLRGRLCLHASAVAIDGKAVALMAPGGGGKSTTAAVFAQLGFPAITDDVLVLLPRSGKLMVQPGYPRINLWPGSIPAVAGSERDLPQIVPGSGSYTKRYLDLHQGASRFQSNPLRLAAIYTGRASRQCLRPVATALPATDAMIALAAQLYRFPLIGRSDLIREFEWLAFIASQIPMRSVAFRRNIDDIHKLCQTILDDFRELHTTKNATPATVNEALI